MERTHRKEEHTFSDFLYWTMMLAIPVTAALTAIFERSTGWFVGYIIVFLGGTAALLRFFCTRCPHYRREGKTLSCMFFWRLPKPFPSSEGPYEFKDKAAVYAACALIVGFPVYWLLHELGLLVVYALSYTVFVLTLKRNECGRCVHAHCPMNETPEGIEAKLKSEGIS